ncbi:major urinary protein-like [Notamacropus eugenii]|uniref:major urinary protein-like n=1 Tax=Notamacropus eugenii TaxID=9315 RepID=UPI003B679630
MSVERMKFFMETSLEDDGHNDFTIQSLGSDHVVYILFNIKDGEVTVWGELFGQHPDLPDEIKKEFEEICERFGIRKDQIIDFSKDDRCEIVIRNFTLACRNS